MNENVIIPLAQRGNGDIYLGVVGAVRTGKSTFIKKFIENLVVPNIDDEIEKKRYLDEIPQSASGKTIMTTEPKFVPSSGANIKIDELLAALKKKEEEQDKNTVLWVLAIIGAVAAVAGIAFAVYRFFAPDYLEDFEEDLDDDFDDYFEDEE